MATINEFSIWEPTIYELEITDPVIGGPSGISNLSRQQLTNRTRKVYDVLEENGIFITESNHEFAGQNLDITAVFEGSVVDGNIVYYHQGNAQYEKAIADGTEKAAFVGVADVTNGKVIAGGFLGNPVITGVPAQGDILFLSNSIAGQMTTSSSPVPVGKYLWTNVISLNSGVGGGGAGDFGHEEDTYRLLLDNSYYSNGSFDDFLNIDLILSMTMDHNFADNKLEFTASEVFTSINLKDPLSSISPITEAFVAVDVDDTGTTIIQVSANGGGSWDTVPNNNVVIFSVPGNDLRIRVTGGGTGEVRSYGLLYGPQFSRKPGLSSVPTNEIILFEKDVAVFTYLLLTNYDDSLIYITKGSAAGGVAGATNRGTWTQTSWSHDHTTPSKVLSINELAIHGHPPAPGFANFMSSSGNTHGDPGDNYGVFGATGNSGANWPHNHGNTGAFNHIPGSSYRPFGRTYTRQQRL